MKMKLLKVNQYLQKSALHGPQTHLSMKRLQIASPYFDAMILSRRDIMKFVTDIMKSVTPNSELLTSLSDENNF